MSWLKALLPPVHRRPERSDPIDLIRGVAIVLVVLGHAIQEHVPSVLRVRCAIAYIGCVWYALPGGGPSAPLQVAGSFPFCGRWHWDSGYWSTGLSDARGGGR